MIIWYHQSEKRDRIREGEGALPEGWSAEPRTPNDMGRAIESPQNQGTSFMALVSYVPTSEAAEKIRPHFEKVESRGHEVPNFLRVLAHSPELLEGFIALNGALGRIKLDPKLRELAYIRASEVNSCGYCLQHHKKAGRKAGLDERQVNETDSYSGSESEIYDDLQRDVLQYAEEVTRNVVVTDELADRLKQKLTARELVELAVAVALANFTNRISETLRLELP
jgi:uncharacterized peroxidase-related enzyme